MLNRLIWRGNLLGVLCLTAILGGGTEAKDAGLPLQGMFCNTLEQIDEALAHVDRGLLPSLAVELTNRHAIACSYIDRLFFVVRDPVWLGQHRGRLSVEKYEAILTGVIVGERFRPVSPPMSIFFATPTPLAETSLGQRT
jgi:hypothetical protein